MAGTQTEDATQQDAEKAQQKKRPEPAPEHVKVLADESVPFAGLLGVSAMGPPFETHATFLGDPRFSHPANNTRKAGLATELQQAYGNQYVQRLVESLNVQAKLTVSSPDDQYEKEADRVADAVTRASTPSIQRQAEEEEEIQSKPIAEQITPLVQRQEEEPEEEEEEEPIQTKLTNDIQVQRQAEEPEEEPEEEEETVQTKLSESKVQMVSEDLESRIKTARGRGQPMADSVRTSMEPQFGHDLGQVHIHTDAEASSLSRQLGAKAFTAGSDIFFREGAYQPGSENGQKLIAHELTHVAQQSKASLSPPGGKVRKRLSGVIYKNEANKGVRQYNPMNANSRVQAGQKRLGLSTSLSSSKNLVQLKKRSLWSRFKGGVKRLGRGVKGLVKRGLGYLKGLAGSAVGFVFETALDAAGVPKKAIMSLIDKGRSTLMRIIKNPGRFVRTLVEAVKQGFSRFAAQIQSHLEKGFMDWLFDDMRKARIQLPNDFSPKAILQLVLQVLDITVEKIRAKVVKIIGEKNMRRFEKVWEIISTLMKEGIGGLWQMLQEYIGDLKDTVIGGIKSWLITEVIKAAVKTVIKMFVPGGGIVAAIKMIYEVVKYLIKWARRIAGLFKSIAGSVVEISMGNTGGAAEKINQALARSIPIVIGFLASLMSISNITDKIKEIIKGIRTRVDKAIDKVIGKVARMVKRWGRRAKAKAKELYGKGKAKAGAAFERAAGKAGLVKGKRREPAEVVAEVKRVIATKTKNPFKSVDAAQSMIKRIFARFQPEGLKSLRLVPKKGKEGIEYDIEASASPGTDVGDVTISGPAAEEEGIPAGVEPQHLDPERYRCVGEPEWGTSEAFILVDTSKQERYLFKPAGGEAKVPRAQARGIKRGTYYRRAKAAEVTAKKLEVPTPRIDIVEYKGQLGSLQKWVGEAQTLQDIEMNAPATYSAIKKSAYYQRLRADIDTFDYLINNLDRNQGNLMVQLDSKGQVKKLIGIDQDLAFPATLERPILPRWTRGLPERYTRSMYEHLKQMDSNRDVLARALRPFLSAAEIEAAFGRLELILKDIKKKLVQVGPDKLFY